LNIVLGLIISIYLLFDRERFFAQTKKLMAAILPRRANTLVTEIAQESHTIFQGFIVGKIIDSIIIGILCYIFMALLQFDFALLISVIVGVTNVVPYFGPFIGAIPGILILYIVEPKQALWFLIFIFLLQQFDGNILGPKILGDSIGISAFWVVFSITLFSGIFGILGMFIGVPLFALLYSLVKRFTAFLLRRKGESTSTRDYDSTVNPLLK
jgi:predicted PurR-regulated permease PerM